MKRTKGKGAAVRAAPNPILVLTADFMEWLAHNGVLSHSEVMDQYGNMGFRILALAKQCRAITGSPMTNSKGLLEHHYQIADRRFSSSSPQDILKAFEETIKKAGFHV